MTSLMVRFAHSRGFVYRSTGNFVLERIIIITTLILTSFILHVLGFCSEDYNIMMMCIFSIF